MSARDFGAVLGDVLGSIPESETALIARLQHVRQGSLFRAPELRGLDWQAAQDALEQHAVGDAPWQRAVLAIWNGRALS